MCVASHLKPKATLWCFKCIYFFPAIIEISRSVSFWKTNTHRIFWYTKQKLIFMNPKATSRQKTEIFVSTPENTCVSPRIYLYIYIVKRSSDFTTLLSHLNRAFFPKAIVYRQVDKAFYLTSESKPLVLHGKEKSSII